MCVIFSEALVEGILIASLKSLTQTSQDQLAIAVSNSFYTNEHRGYATGCFLHVKRRLKNHQIETRKPTPIHHYPLLLSEAPMTR